MNNDVVERLRAAFQRVKFCPEDSETGLVDLLTLRNLVPDAISEIEPLRAQQSSKKEGETNAR